MSEAGLITVIGLILGIIQTFVMLYFKAKFNVQIDNQKTMMVIADDHTEKLNSNSAALKSIHSDINSRITELIESKMVEAQAHTREVVRQAVEEAIRQERAAVRIDRKSEKDSDRGEGKK